MSVMIRPISVSDCDLVCRHRKEMFLAAGHEEAALAAMAETYREWQHQCLEDGSYFGFVAESAGLAVGGIGLMAIDWPPHPMHPTVSKRGYVLNLFVEPDWRGQGIAKKLMAAGEAELCARGLDFAILHATRQARPLYEKAGWNQTSELAKRIG